MPARQRQHGEPHPPADPLGIPLTRALDAYGDALRRAGNPLVATETVWLSARAQAEGILTECLRALHEDGTTGTGPDTADPENPGGIDPEAEWTSLAVGVRRAAERIDPIDSIRAAQALFETASLVLVDEARALPADTALAHLGRASRTLHRAISSRVAAAAIGYEASTLRHVGEANTARRDELARDIHDHIGSSLSLALRCLDLYEAELALGRTQDPAQGGRDRLADARKALLSTFGFTRRLVGGLRAYDLRDSLSAEIDEYTRTASTHGARVTVTLNGDETWMTDRQREEIFLVVRECLRNAFAHAAAQRVDVLVNIAPDLVEGTVEDDGTGFDPDAADHRPGGGIAGMGERVRALGGAFTLTGRPGHGTRARFTVPLGRPASPATGPSPRTEAPAR
ncbi:sensor histidine kinase [Streptomyces sp. BI20]|uniref:sensor histidine kinase n=1 Tax=Streptomyces sp. BI20 TaxID=3403460 RepID=UPI003C739A57